jgi:pimeloyl-ACP methyl ester carboxylesterase
MRRLTLTLLAAVMMTVANAQEAAYKILHQCDTTVKAQVEVGGLSLGSRDTHYIVYEYPSKDGDGKPVTISGVVLVPSDVANGTVPCDGIILYNRFTVDNDAEAPSKGGIGLQVPSFILASPLKPNYIIVSSDYIGYGSSFEGHNMSYFCGDINARNSIDGLVAARKMLTDLELPLGKYQFNVGNSQGGTVAMYVAKLRDMEYKDIKFDKTFIGGAVLDCEKAYSEFVKKDAMGEWRDVAMFFVSANENYHLGIKYDELFKEPVASLIPEFLKTKDKAVLAPETLGKIDSLHQVLQPAYMDIKSDKAKVLLDKLAQIKISNGWEPDITQNYYITHCRHDNYIPVQCSRELLKWMKDKGFKPSLVPGKTSLQTNMMVFKLNHLYSAIFWAIQSLAAIQFWPVVYYEGEQNRYYHDVVKDLNLLKTIKYLESMGIDLRSLAAGATSGSDGKGMDLFSMITKITEALKKVDLTITDFYEMLEDSGISIMDIMEVVNYIQSKPETPTMAAKDASAPALIDTDAMMSDEAKAAIYLLQQYEQTLTSWYKLAGYDVNYNQWGW